MIKNNIKFIVLVLLLVLTTASSIYFWNDSKGSKQLTDSEIAQKNKNETQQIVNALKKILLINEIEEPTVAKVEDPSVLQKDNPDFYKNIQAGDYLILYPQRAIIYRSENNQVINIAPIIIDNQVQKVKP